MNPGIRVEGLTLSVPIYLQREREARNWGGMFLGAAFDPPKRELVKLLDDVSFHANEGDRVAILGRNGAGKSTLLRVLNGVYAPTQGRVEVHGSCQALLNMSLGFNGEATVRENIFLRGTAMGLRAAMLREHVEPILQFSGLANKSTHRLRTLSAGQKMRLGFAISTTFQHDIILMDEWVGAGDAEFMAKATQRMKSRVNGSKIVMLASHSVGLLRDICNKGIVLERGRLIYAGEIMPALQRYHDLLAELRANPEAEIAAAESGVPDRAYGCVEQVVVDGRTAVVTGWSVGGAGQAQSGMVLISGGVRHSPTAVEHYRRPDVMQHLGLNDDNCGIRARFELPPGTAGLGPDLQVLAGDSPEHAHWPLRIAASVIEQLRDPSQTLSASGLPGA